MPVRYSEITHSSDAKSQALALRHEVLREPLGLIFSPEDIQRESGQIQLAGMLNNKVVAILLLAPLPNNIFKMRQVAVSPQHQNGGIGKALVNYSEKYVQQQGGEKIELHARLTASKFYLDLAYETDDVIFEEVGIPHIKMWKWMPL